MPDDNVTPRATRPRVWEGRYSSAKEWRKATTYGERMREGREFLKAQKEARAQQPTFKERVAAKQQARQDAIDDGEKPIATYAPGIRTIKLYADGRIESPFGSGSVIGATARVDQSGSKRVFRDTRQAYLTIEGPQVAIAQKLTSTGGMSVNLARKFAAQVNKLAAAHQPTAPAASAVNESIPDQIRKLAELRDQEILTNDEFEAKKAELLGRL